MDYGRINMKDMKNREVEFGDTVVFNHPYYRVLDSSPVHGFAPNGIIVTCHMLDDKTEEVVIPEKQFAIIAG